MYLLDANVLSELRRPRPHWRRPGLDRGLTTLSKIGDERSYRVATPMQVGLSGAKQARIVALVMPLEAPLIGA